MLKLLALVAVLLTFLASAAAANGDDSTIREDARIGAFRTKTAPMLADAVRVFGPPSSQRQVVGTECHVVWRSRGLAMVFLDLDQTTKPCEKGGFVQATMIGRAWHTASGLRVVDGTVRLKRLFPHASLVRGAGANSGWWLVTRHACEEVGGEAFPGLLARVIDGRLAAFVLQLGVCE